ncbi:unnamed protein product [Laminaria digitata]
MKIESLNIWAGLVANICVIAGIVFLAIEVNQNSQMMAAGTRSNITDRILHLTELQSSFEMRDVRLTRARDEELSDEQLMILRSLYVLRLRHWEDMVYQYNLGLFDEEEMEGVLAFIQNNFNDPIMGNVWRRQRPFYSQSFVDFIDMNTNQ